MTPPAPPWTPERLKPEELDALQLLADGSSDRIGHVSVDQATLLRLLAQVREAEARLKEAEAILTHGQRQRLSWRRDTEGR